MRWERGGKGSGGRVVGRGLPCLRLAQAAGPAQTLARRLSRSGHKPSPHAGHLTPTARPHRYEMWGLVAYNGIMALSFLIVSFGDYFL